MEPSVEQLKNRASAMASGTQTSTTQEDISNDPFITTLQNYLLQNSGMRTSSTTGIDEKINQAIEGITKSKESSALKLESQAERQRSEILKKGTETRSAFEESQRGFATNSAALQQINEATDKDLKDLEMRKQELLLSGESEAASKIADLQLKSIEFKQQAQQQIFSNMLSLGQFNLQQRAEERAGEQFKQNLDFQKQQIDFNQKSKIAEIATEFGLTITPETTLDSIVSEAAPLASAKRKAELAKLQSESKTENNLWTLDNELISSLVGGSTSSEAVTSALAKASAFNIKLTGEDYNRLLNRAVELEKTINEQKTKQSSDSAAAKKAVSEAISPFIFSGGNQGSKTSALGQTNNPLAGLDLSNLSTSGGINTSNLSTFGGSKNQSKLDVTDSLLNNLFGI